MFYRKKVKFIKQLDSNDCGLACLAMFINYFGKEISLNLVKNKAKLTSDGISVSHLREQASIFDLNITPLYLNSEQLKERLALPAIAYWEQNHFLIVEKITSVSVSVIDPAFGRFRIPMEEFLDGWIIDNSLGCHTPENKTNKRGVLMLVNPLPGFDSIVFPVEEDRKDKWQFIKGTFLTHRKDNIRIFLNLLIVSLLQLFLPFANKLLVDYGIQQRNMSVIYLVALFISIFYLLISINEFIRSWSLTYLSARINYNLISKFLRKITRLPIKTIYSRKIGDYVERIHDHKRLEEYFSESIIRCMFSTVSILVYAVVLVFFSFKVFIIVFGLTIIELVWIFRFLNTIKTFDNKLFTLNAQDQDKVYEILSNLADIKLNNIEEDKNKEWRHIQGNLFKNNLKKMKLNQIEQGVSKILSAIQLFSLTVISAVFVVKGEISVGEMLSILFIVNQLNFPISNLINFVINTQVIGNSFQRIFEIHDLPEEDEKGVMPENLEESDVAVGNLRFSYNSYFPVLKDISFTIPKNKTTAIVGYSGSGKTTLLKLLLKFYDNYEGSVSVGRGGLDLNKIKSSYWRDVCGAVLQESALYSESIVYNISLKRNNEVDKDRLEEAIRLACLSDFIEGLPLKIFTKLNANGSSLSAGQRQRLLIARLIYKNPSFVFLDEATNCLDANTEKVVLNNLAAFFKNKTVLIVAHRLSTVKNADQIVVLDKGKISEIGSHSELIANQGNYFNLIKNQLELEYEG